MHPAPEPAGRPRWSATSQPGRWLLIAAGLLLALSVAILVQAVRVPRIHQVRRVAGPVAVQVDAAGCPLGARCTSGSTAPPAMLAAIKRAFPAIEVSSVLGVYEASDTKPFRVTVTAELGSALTLTLIAQRLPGAPANDPETIELSTPGHTDLGGNLAIESRILRALVPGAPGCSLSLSVSSPGSGAGYDDAALQLAHDRDAQLSP